MSKLIERYVYDVTRRLPERDREEVSRELTANLYDMLPENAADAEIERVLNELGSPAVLAEKYRQGQRYLISPNVFEDYIRALKWIPAMVAGIVFLVMLVLGGVNAAIEGAEAGDIIGEALGEGLAGGISAAFQTVVWITIGFAIADHAGYKRQEREEWTVANLPSDVPDKKYRIPLSDSIVELILSFVFAGFFLFLAFGFFPVVKADGGATRIYQLFSTSALPYVVACTALVLVSNAAQCIVKIIHRRWTPAVCGTVVGTELVSSAFTIYVLFLPNLLNPELLSYIHEHMQGTFSVLRIGGVDYGYAAPLIIAAIIVIATVATCITAIVKTIRAQQNRI